MIEISRILSPMLRTTTSKEAEPARWLDVVNNQVNHLRFGIVQIVVHDGRVVQIEKTEKIRFDKANVDAT